jgi:hypothetical protein
MFDADVAKWWSDLAQMDRSEFEKLAADQVRSQGGLAMLHHVAAAGSGSS